MDYTIEQVVEVNPINVEQDGHVLNVEQEIVLADGTTLRGRLTFPADTLEWRAAEYDLDPQDKDTLLDIVLCEPFLGEPDNPGLLLHEATSVEEARAYHLQRVAEFKAKASKRAQGKPAAASAAKGASNAARDRIKDLSVVNPEAVGLKRELVAETRERVRQNRERVAKAGLRSLFVEGTPDPEEMRLANLRSTLAATRGTRQTHRERNNGFHITS